MAAGGLRYPDTYVIVVSGYLKWSSVVSFVQREIDRLSSALRENPNADDYASIYAAQQALSWAMEPMGIKAPMEMLRGIQAGSTDCSAHPHPLPS